jgi:hypothetical protein
LSSFLAETLRFAVYAARRAVELQAEKVETYEKAAVSFIHLPDTPLPGKRSKRNKRSERSKRSKRNKRSE